MECDLSDEFLDEGPVVLNCILNSEKNDSILSYNKGNVKKEDYNEMKTPELGNLFSTHLSPNKLVCGNRKAKPLLSNKIVNKNRLMVPKSKRSRQNSKYHSKERNRSSMRSHRYKVNGINMKKNKSSKELFQRMQLKNEIFNGATLAW